MTADITWSRRALQLYQQGDAETALTEIGPEHMQLLHVAIQQALARRLPLPGQPGWDDYLTYLQTGLEQQLGPLDAPDRNCPHCQATSITITEHHGENIGHYFPA